MKTSVSKDLFASAKTIAARFLIVAALLSLSSCLNDEFRTGTDIVNGEDMVVGETSFPVKAWTVPDPVRDTLSARVESDIVYQIGDPVNNNKKGYNFDACPASLLGKAGPSGASPAQTFPGTGPRFSRPVLQIRYARGPAPGNFFWGRIFF